MDHRLGARADSRSRASAEATMPRSARRFIELLLATAAALSVGVGLLDTSPVSLAAVALLATAITIGDALAVDLPFRRAGIARFALGDVSLAVGLMILSPTEVVIGAAIGVTAGQLLERQPSRRVLFNVGQYVTGASSAAAVMLAAGVAGTGPDVRSFLAAAAGLALFSTVNTLSVATIISLTSAATWRASVLRIAPTAALLAVGNAALGLVAVLLLDTHPWALPALAIPLALLFMASRQEVRAQLERERSTEYASVERRLGELVDPEEVAVTLVDGTARILGCRAAIWMDGDWIGEVPAGSRPCPVDPELEAPLVTRGPSLGPAVDSPCAAIGVGGGVLVVWRGELGLTRDTEEWLPRLAQSGRAHFERATASTALENERATLRGVVDGTRDGICVLDADGIIRLWNPAMGRLATKTADEAIGASVWQILGEGEWTTDGVHDVERGEEDRVWRVSVSSVRDGRHGALRVAVVHDITAERRVARMKDDMLAVVSHELRTPLTPIKASAQLLRRRWDRMGTGGREDLLDRIEERSDHMTRLVGDILLVGQLSASSGPRIDVARTEIDLSGLLHEVVTAQRAAHHTHEFSLTTPDVVPAMTDPVRLRQILENLTDNACKFSQPGSLVDLTLSVGDGIATLAITDEGRGIAADDLDRVFERFERVEDPLVMTTSGAGLGLFIVRELVTALGGGIELESTLGRGTTVTVRLPLHPREPGTRTTRAEDRARTSQG